MKFIDSDAHLSQCRKYRYKLWRVWDKKLPACNYIMLNPSTADETKSDSTITRCINRARALDYGGIIVANLFAYRTPHPKELYKFPDPVGPENNKILAHIAENTSMVICAWGDGGMYQERGEFVIKMLKNLNVKLYHLGLTKSGSPLHPSARGKTQCISYNLSPMAF